MKKISLILLSIIITISLLCSCSFSDTDDTLTDMNVVAYLFDASDSFSTVSSHNKDFMPTPSSYYDETAEKEVSITYNGVEYKGTYTGTDMAYMDNRFVDVYEGYHLSFGLTHDTKELYYISGAKLDENEPTDKIRNFSVDECIKIANNIASQYINVSEYSVKTSTIDSVGIEMVSYRKSYNGVPTSELLMIDISYVTGKQLGFSMRSIGQFDNEEISKSKSAVELLLKEGKKVAYEKAEEICKEICNKNGYTLKSITEKEDKRMLYRCANGDYILITNYKIDYGFPSELLSIVTVVEDSSPAEKISAE